AGMEGLSALEAELFEEMKSRLNPDDASVPVQMDGYWYQTRFEKGLEYPKYYRRQGSMDAEEVCILDVNALAEDQAYCQVSGIHLTADHQRMAYGVDFVSRRLYTLRFVDLATQTTWDYEVPGTSGGFAWAADGETFFYATKDSVTLRVDKIWRQKLGSSAEPELVYHEKDETFSCGVYRSKSKRFIHIATGATDVDELWYLESDEPTGAFQVLRPREMGVEYGASHFGDSWYIRSNIDGRKNYALFKAPIEQPTSWTPVLEHRSDVLLEGMELFKDFMVTEERTKGLVRLVVRPWDGSAPFEIDQPEETYTLYAGSNPTEDTEWMRYGYTSLVTPASTYEYNMRTGERRLLKQQEVMGGYDASKFVTKRYWATAPDGTQIPISWVGPVNAVDRPVPTLLYGYGSYGITIDPTFSIARLSLLDRGMAYAIAHIRGGQERGREWYEDGKMMNKINTFTDFIDVTDALQKQAIIDPKRTYARGGSAGGLLMGAVLNMAPALYHGVIAAVPFVDVITTMSDPSIPLTTGEWNEWGDPREKAAYDYMLSYSPYDQVSAQDYPNLLVTTGLHDSQVQYFEPAKWVAKLREYRTDQNKLMLYTDMSAGHSGASGRLKRFDDYAREFAFLVSLSEGQDAPN
ncbi:MAG: S9 family peptidase, partial [Flavobacteriia bacterium]|nr:S9 family peptidase [Flavobacteriia bacterium]